MATRAVGRIGGDVHSALMSSKAQDWRTPPALFATLNAEFGPCDLDLAASAENALVSTYYTAANNALTRAWHRDGRIGWCNPPYARAWQGRFVEKAVAERAHGFRTVLLLPARTDTQTFHRWLYDVTTDAWRPHVRVRFLPQRVRFSNAATGAPFPSMVVVIG